MTTVNEDFLARWHPVVNERDLVGLEKLLAADITMGAPPYWDKLSGRPLVRHLLGLIIHTIEDFTYHRRIPRTYRRTGYSRHRSHQSERTR